MPGKSSQQRRALDALNAAMVPVLEAAGVKDVLCKILGTTNAHNVVNATVAAAAPGTAETVKPASRVARTRRSPGSEMPGVPASLTSATLFPAVSASINIGPARSALCS